LSVLSHGDKVLLIGGLRVGLVQGPGMIEVSNFQLPAIFILRGVELTPLMAL